MFKAFLGIAPSLRLFRFYYQIIRNKKGAGALGSFYFKFQDANKRVFPFLATKDASQTRSKEWYRLPNDGAGWTADEDPDRNTVIQAQIPRASF